MVPNVVAIFFAVLIATPFLLARGLWRVALEWLNRALDDVAHLYRWKLWQAQRALGVR